MIAKNKKTAAIDFESYYDDDVGAKLGMHNYTRHYLFECFTVSFATSEGVEWSGHPKDCPWDKLRGHVFVSHNRSFDHAVLKWMAETGKAPPDIMPEEWYCSANLCAYLGFPRALAQAVGVLYNVNLSKATRGALKGLHWQDMTEEFQAEVIHYAIDDSRWCLKIWMDYSDQWPEHERQIALHTDMMGARGVPVDVEAIDKAIDLATRALDAAFDAIPWTKPWQLDGKTLPAEKPLGRKGLNALCAANGLIPPASLAEDDEDCALWEETYGPRFPWVAAMRNYRRINTILKKVVAMRQRVMPNGWMEYSLLYFGADTGRWAGAGGVNCHNFPQHPFYFDENLALVDKETDLMIDMRGFIRAELGMVLASSDTSAIEPRCSALLSGNRTLLAQFEKGYGPYEALARATMGWTGGELRAENPDLYALCKGKLLSFQYGAGWFKYISMCAVYIGKKNADKILQAEPPEHEIEAFKRFIFDNDFNISYRPVVNAASGKDLWVFVNAWIQMRDFRAENPLLIALWKRCGDTAKASIGGTAEFVLPSGRTMRFLNVVKREGQLMCRTIKGGNFSKYYPSKFMQNINQGLARDVFAEAVLRVEAAGIPVILHIHDEILAHVPEGFDKNKLTELMTIRPAWAKRLPIASDTKIMPKYKK